MVGFRGVLDVQDVFKMPCCASVPPHSCSLLAAKYSWLISALSSRLGVFLISSIHSRVVWAIKAMYLQGKLSTVIEGPVQVRFWVDFFL